MIWLLAHPLLAQAGVWETITDPAWWERSAEGLPQNDTFLVTVGALLLDLVLRNLKTDKPKSIMRGVAVIFLGLARVFERLALLIDGLLGQKALLKAAPVVPIAPKNVEAGVPMPKEDP